MSDGRCGVGDTERDLESEEQEIAGDETDKESVDARSRRRTPLVTKIVCRLERMSNWKRK